jgi:hypothetical protein
LGKFTEGRIQTSRDPSIQLRVCLDSLGQSIIE